MIIIAVISCTDAEQWFNLVYGLWTSPYLTFSQSSGVPPLYWSRCLFLILGPQTLLRSLSMTIRTGGVSRIIQIPCAVSTSCYHHCRHSMLPWRWAITYSCVRPSNFSVPVIQPVFRIFSRTQYSMFSRLTHPDNTISPCHEFSHAKAYTSWTASFYSSYNANISLSSSESILTSFFNK